MNAEWQMPETVAADLADPRVQEALTELQELIRQRYPAASFTVTQRQDDPEGIFFTAVVDIDDLDEVTDLVLRRMVDMQLDEGLPIYVVAEWPAERIRVYLRQQTTQRAGVRLPVVLS